MTAELRLIRLGELPRHSTEAGHVRVYTLRNLDLVNVLQRRKVAASLRTEQGVGAEMRSPQLSDLEYRRPC
jgi:hypothetical protein